MKTEMWIETVCWMLGVRGDVGRQLCTGCSQRILTALPTTARSHPSRPVLQSRPAASRRRLAPGLRSCLVITRHSLGICAV